MRQVLQTQRAECSIACLAMVASAHGHYVELAELRKRFAVSLKGARLAQLVTYAESLGFTSRGVRAELSELRSLRVPCILHWNLNHFVVLKKVIKRGVVIIDPAMGERRLSFDETSRHFTGVALELTPNTNFRRAIKRERIDLAQLTGRVRGLWTSLLQIFVAAAVLELFAIVAPLFHQIVVDDVMTSGDQELLTVLALGFGLLLLIQTAIGLARSWMVMVLGQTLGLQWTANVFSHLLRLPTSFFERRHLGDVVSRFGSIGAVQRTMTTAVIEALLDGLMALASLGMMCMYSIRLTSVTLIAVAGYAALRIASYRPFRQAAAERLSISARENSHFLETLRAITPLKLFGKEEVRRARWQNLVVDVQNRDIRTAKLGIVFSTANTFIFGIENLVVFWMGANIVMANSIASVNPAAGPSSFTIGMLFAFISYKGQFTGRVSALINYAVELKMLGLHAERLADITLSSPERDIQTAGGFETDLAHLPACLELRNISFKYAEGEPWVLRNINLKIEAGENVAITGPSGCGKSTLLKIMLVLLVPSEGEILYGGVSVNQLGRKAFRQMIGTVMQDDSMLAGSLADNISFFDMHPDQQLVERCAKVARLHEDIVRMPMGYYSLVGDMGHGLSGGQKQRLLLARALYKQPKVLALDEATSHLDVENERAVALSLAQLSLTRIVIAHRAETINAATRIVSINNGSITDDVRTSLIEDEKARPPEPTCYLSPLGHH